MGRQLRGFTWQNAAYRCVETQPPRNWNVTIAADHGGRSETPSRSHP
jgi:hypothetical protein